MQRSIVIPNKYHPLWNKKIKKPAEAYKSFRRNKKSNKLNLDS